jgi:hypothetical protein
MSVPRRSCAALLAVGLSIACLLGQVGVVSPAQAGGTLAGPLFPRAETSTLLMSEDFEGDWPTAGWNVFDANGATGGEFFWDEDDFKPHGGSQSAWPANGGANAVDPAVSHYGIFVDAWMVYGPFDLSAYNAGSFEFYWWNESEGDYDFFSWGASHDGVNFDWTSVSGGSRTWFHQDVDLSAYAGDASVWIAFRFQSDESFCYDGPFVDDIRLWGTVGTAPAAFGKASPADGAAGQPLSPILTWGSVADATSYEYCYDTSNDGACSTWVDAGSATSAGVGSLALDTTYYWQVRAINDYGTTYADGAQGAYWDFTTGGPPGAFGKASPADGAVGRPLGSTLTWEAAAEATSYEYCLDVSNDDACDYAWVPVGGATSAGVGPLALDTTYYWQVRAINDFGTSHADGGAWWDFTTGGPPGAFGKVAPADGAVGRPLALTLSWGASAGATSYEYCFDPSDNDLCSDGWESTGTETSVSLPDVETNTLYWQVRATNDFGTTYADSGAWWDFTTVATATFRSVGMYDGWVLEQDEDSGKGGTFDAAAATGRLGDDDSDRQYRSILHFDTATLPDNAVVVGVTLRVKRQGITGTSPFGAHGLLKVDLQAGAYHEVAALEKYDFQAIGTRGNVGRFIKTPSEGWYRAPLRAVSYPLINLTGTTQFRLRFDLDHDDDLSADFLRFYSGDAIVEADRPELTITYYVP